MQPTRIYLTPEQIAQLARIEMQIASLEAGFRAQVDLLNRQWQQLALNFIQSAGGDANAEWQPVQIQGITVGFMLSLPEEEKEGENKEDR